MFFKELGDILWPVKHWLKLKNINKVLSKKINSIFQNDIDVKNRGIYFKVNTIIKEWIYKFSISWFFEEKEKMNIPFWNKKIKDSRKQMENKMINRIHSLFLCHIFNFKLENIEYSVNERQYLLLFPDDLINYKWLILDLLKEYKYSEVFKFDSSYIYSEDKKDNIIKEYLKLSELEKEELLKEIWNNSILNLENNSDKINSFQNKIWEKFDFLNFFSLNICRDIYSQLRIKNIFL
jgi:hypothetical protein